MKILSAFSSVGIGETYIHHYGNFTAIEIESKLANEYKIRFPNAEILIQDAYPYIYANYHKFDIILASPPCQSYSKLTQINSRQKTKPKPDERIFQLIQFLGENFNGIFIIENVNAKWLNENSLIWTPIKPVKIGRHLFWSNKVIKNSFVYPTKNFRFDKQTDAEGNLTATQTYIKRLQDWLGVKLSKNYYIRGNHDPGQIYREGIHPLLMKYIFDQIVD